MTSFLYGEMQQHVRDGFSILLPATYVVQVFGDKLKLSHIAAYPQAHQHLRLILNLLEDPD